MIEVFKTNVQEPSQAKKLVTLLREHIPNSKINFDLDDCDKVLRVEGKNLAVEKIVGLVKENGYICYVLE